MPSNELSRQVNVPLTEGAGEYMFLVLQATVILAPGHSLTLSRSECPRRLKLP